jgi:hypothetical protein
LSIALADHWVKILGLQTRQVNETREVGYFPEGQLAKNRDYTHDPYRGRATLAPTADAERH